MHKSHERSRPLQATLSENHFFSITKNYASYTLSIAITKLSLIKTIPSFEIVVVLYRCHWSNMAVFIETPDL